MLQFKLVSGGTVRPLNPRTEIGAQEQHDAMMSWPRDSRMQGTAADAAALTWDDDGRRSWSSPRPVCDDDDPFSTLASFRRKSPVDVVQAVP